MIDYKCAAIGDRGHAERHNTSRVQCREYMLMPSASQAGPSNPNNNESIKASKAFFKCALSLPMSNICN